MTHICVTKLTIIGSDNGLSPDRRQAIIWTNAGILSIGPLGTNFSEILIEILTSLFKKMRLKVSSAKRRPFCLGLNVLTSPQQIWWVSDMGIPLFLECQSCFNNGTPTYSSLCLLMAWHLTVLGHQQAQVDIFSSRFLLLSWLLITFWWPTKVIKNSWQNLN